MSGGRFDYREHNLVYVSEDLLKDIKNNDIPYDSQTNHEEGNYGFGLQPFTVDAMKKMVVLLDSLYILLHDYDYMVDGGKNEQDFNKSVETYLDKIHIDDDLLKLVYPNGERP